MGMKKIKNHIKYYISLFNNLSDGLLIIRNNFVIHCNNSAVKMFGYHSKEKIVGLPLHQLSSEDHQDGSLSIETINQNIPLVIKNRRHKFEWLNTKKDGSKVYSEVELIRLYDDKQKIISAIIKDITENKNKEKKIKHLSMKDSLTGLYNRSFFMDRLNNELRKTNNQNLAIMCIDLDGFKKVNDNLGYDLGDEALKIVSKKIEKCIRSSDILARIGDDEFSIVLTHIKENYEIVRIAKNIINSFKDPIHIEGYELYISVSIGIVLYPMNGETADALIRNADIAMYKAKKNNSNHFEFYNSSLNKKLKEEFIIENELRYALERNEFSLYYQPIVNIEKDQLVGTEALIRWHHPKYGLISPDKFIPIAEKRGLIGIIGEWVLKTACLQNKKWQDLGYPSIFVAVNISVKQLEQNGFINLVHKIINETKLEPKYLELEITESISMRNIRNRIDRLKKLKELGVGLSIDDFGTGYSSLAQLKELPFNNLKIDKSFINDINININNSAIVSTIIAIAKNFNLNVVAEGVETKEQLQFLKKQNCDMIQGYLYSPPVPVDSFENILKDFKSVCKVL